MPEHIRQEPKVLVSTENLTEQEWLAYRRQGIGGSDVAAILGISPFRTARDLYDDKLNIIVDCGTCKGWTLAQVADRRAASLRWYVKGYQGENNILRAAAAIIWDSLQEKQAG